MKDIVLKYLKKIRGKFFGTGENSQIVQKSK